MMTLRTAYMAMAKLPSCQEEPSVCREWVWEYILKHCSNQLLIRALLQSYPIPPHSLPLKRLLLLKFLSLEVLDDDRFSERTIEILSELSPSSSSSSSSSSSLPSSSSSAAAADLLSHRAFPHRFHMFHAKNGRKTGKESFTFSELLFAVRAECIVQHLREETDNWPKFCDLLKKSSWRDWIPASDQSGEEKMEKEIMKKKKKEKEEEEEEEKRIQERYSQLMQDLQDIKEHPDRRHNFLKRFNRGKVKNMVQGFLSEAWESLGSVFLEQVAESVKKGLYLPQGFTLSVSPIARKEPSVDEDSSDAQATKDVDSVLRGKNLEKSHVEGASSAKNVVIEEKDGYDDMEGSSPPFRGKRHIPISLKENTKESFLRRSKLGDAQLVEEIEVRASSFKPSIRKSLNETLLVDGSHGKLVKESEKAVLPTTDWMLNEEEDADEPVRPSPPPWTKSPDPNANITIRRKRRKIGAILSNADHARDTVPICRNILDSPEIQKAQSALLECQASLNAVVKDPLPEALRIAEEAAKSRNVTLNELDNSKGILHVKDDIQGQQARPSERHTKDVNTISPIKMRGSAQAFGKKQSRSIMDRNPTAQKIEWSASDDISNSPLKDDSPSCSRRVQLPTLRQRQSTTMMKDLLSKNVSHRRKFRRWTQEEENVLRNEVERYGKGHWKHILRKHSSIFENRTEVDLKDKWRNIEKREG